MPNLLEVFLLAAAITALLTPAAIRIAPKIGAMDVPKDNRRMHKKPIPRFGGIAIFLGILISNLVYTPINKQSAGILAGAACIVALGIVDDIKGLRPKVKLAGQIICAAIPCTFSVRIGGIGNPLSIGPSFIQFPIWFSVLVTVIWVIGIVNTINLIDGLDGLAAGISCISCLSVAYTAYMSSKSETCYMILAVAGAAAGFLIFNSHPAKIFMGDSGSMMLGYMLATVSIISNSPTKRTALFATIIPIVIMALPIFDTAFAIVRRVVNHRPIMEADKGHIHHRIMAMGFGQRRTVLALYSISAIMGIAGILFTMRMWLEACALAVIAMCLIVVFLGIGRPEKKEEDTASAEEEALPSAGSEFEEAWKSFEAEGGESGENQ